MTPFHSVTLFALLESYIPRLLHPEAISDRKPIPVVPRGGVAAVSIQGVLGSASDFFTNTSYQEIQGSIRRAVKDPAVDRIALHIDSPGGSVAGLPETATLIAQANRIKPVTAHVHGIAASAAYWLASQAGNIVATESAEVGSVGIVDVAVDLSKMFDQQGIKVNAVRSAPFKQERAPFEPLSADARAFMQRNVDQWHGQFVGAIHRGRGARVQADSTFGGGRMLSAKAALAAGMIDFITTETL